MSTGKPIDTQRTPDRYSAPVALNQPLENLVRLYVFSD
jgi:hypothetical protein